MLRQTSRHETFNRCLPRQGNDRRRCVSRNNRVQVLGIPRQTLRNCAPIRSAVTTQAQAKQWPPRRKTTADWPTLSRLCQTEAARTQAPKCCLPYLSLAAVGRSRRPRPTATAYRVCVSTSDATTRRHKMFLPCVRGRRGFCTM